MYRGVQPGGFHVLCGSSEDAAGWVQIFQGDLFTVVHGASQETVRALYDRLQTYVPRRPRVPDDTTVAIRFWMLGPHGPESTSRRVEAACWGDVAENYPERTRSALNRLMGLTKPDRSGQLLLWHGEAGTGKTWGIRAMAQAWQDWCDVEYVIDPDTMFGQHAAYLARVLLEVGSGPVVPNGSQEMNPLRWRLLILEDTAELLTIDAGERTGQGLARLLNTTDGLLGQGLRVLVLLTTNEPIGKLHPALIRPGRCFANVAFERLSDLEAHQWLDRRGVSARLEGQPTLADLYGTVNGHVPSQRRQIGLSQ